MIKKKQKKKNIEVGLSKSWVCVTKTRSIRGVVYTYKGVFLIYLQKYITIN
jgi:hypothetical protein